MWVGLWLWESYHEILIFFEDFLLGLGLIFLRSDQKNKSSIGLKKCLSKIENKNLYLDLKKVRARS